MNLSPKMIRSVSHPFISAAYIREDFSGSAKRPVKVLVIDAVAASAFKNEDAREKAYNDFLANLDIISDGVERHEGAFDHIDIRMH